VVFLHPAGASACGSRLPYRAVRGPPLPSGRVEYRESAAGCQQNTVRFKQLDPPRIFLLRKGGAGGAPLTPLKGDPPFGRRHGIAVAEFQEKAARHWEMRGGGKVASNV